MITEKDELLKVANGLFLTKQNIAKEYGISPSYLTNVLKGKEPLSEGMKFKLNKIIQDYGNYKRTD